MVTQDAETGKELGRRDLVKGYEFKKDHYLMSTPLEFKSAEVKFPSSADQVVVFA